MHRVSVDEHWLKELVADLPTLLSNAERLLSTKLSHVAQGPGSHQGKSRSPSQLELSVLNDYGKDSW